MSRSFDLKLERAYEHLNSLETEADAWIKTEPYGIVDEPDPEPPLQPIGNDVQARRIRIDRVDTVPDRLSILVGDCVFNLRATLDHLAFALAKAHKPRMNTRQITGSEFPIFGPLKMDADAERKKIGCINPAAVAIIKNLQPYRRGNGYATHPLWQIHDLNRIDKHRALAICGAEPMKEGVRGMSLPFDSFKNWRGSYVYWQSSARFAFKLNAIWARWAPQADDLNQEVSVQPEVSVEIVFDESGPASLEPVIPTLRALCDFVRDAVIAQLSTFL